MHLWYRYDFLQLCKINNKITVILSNMYRVYMCMHAEIKQWLS